MADAFDWMDESGLAALGQGVKGFAQGWQDAEDRKMKRLEMDSKAEAQKSERERQQFMDKLTAREKGLDVQPGKDFYSQDPAHMGYRDDYLAKEREKAMISAAADPYGAKKLGAENARLEGVQKSQEIQAKAQENKRRTISPIQGYQKSENYVATPDEEKHLRSAQGDLINFNKSMDGLREKVAAADPKELANPFSDTAKAIKNDLRDLQLVYKGEAFAKLGVLTGPDLKLLEDVIENPGSLSNLVSGKDGVLDRYDQAKSRVNDKFGAKATALGLVPAQEDAPPDTKPGWFYGSSPRKHPQPVLDKDERKGLVKATPLQKTMTPLERSGSADTPPDLAAKQKRLEELKRKAAGG